MSLKPLGWCLQNSNIDTFIDYFKGLQDLPLPLLPTGMIHGFVHLVQLYIGVLTALSNPTELLMKIGIRYLGTAYMEMDS